MSETATKTQRTLVVTEEPQPVFDAEPEIVAPDKTIDRLALLWAQRRTLFRWALVGMTVSLATAFLLPKRYDSVARLMPPDQASPGSMMLAALAGGVGGSSGAGGSQLGSIASDLLGFKSTGELFAGVLQSRTVEDDIIDKFNLHKIYSARLPEDARKALEKNTDVSIDRKSQIIKIEVTDHDPHRAAAITQEYIDQLNHVVVNLNTSSAHREREFLDRRLVQVKADLETAEKGFSEFASKNTAIDIPAQGKAMIEAAATLEGQLIANQTELESLRQVYTDSNVRVRETEARIEELQRQLQKLDGKAGASGSSSESNETIPPIRQLPILGVPYADLYRNTKVEESIFETLTAQDELAKVEEAKETPSVKVLDSPDVPQKKSFPPRILITVLGTFLAFFAAVAWVSARAIWNETDAGDPRKLLAQEVAASVRSSLPWISRNGHSQHTTGGNGFRLPGQSKDQALSERK
jgi:capsule polysaccharide export protein KpsE/RkpR